MIANYLKLLLFFVFLLLLISCSPEVDNKEIVVLSFVKANKKKSALTLSDVDHVRITIKAYNELVGQTNIGIENQKINFDSKANKITLKLHKGKYRIMSLNLYKLDGTNIFYAPYKGDKNQSSVTKPLPLDFDIPLPKALDVEIIESDEKSIPISNYFGITNVKTYKYTIVSKDENANGIKGVNIIIYKKSSSSSKKWSVVYNGIADKNDSKVIFRFREASTSKYKVELSKPGYTTSWIAEGTNTKYKNNPLAIINMNSTKYIIKFDLDSTNSIGGANFRQVDTSYWKGKFEKHSSKKLFMGISPASAGTDSLEWKFDIKGGKNYKLHMETMALSGATNAAKLHINLGDMKIYFKKGVSGSGDGSKSSPMGLGDISNPGRLDKVYNNVNINNSSKLFIKVVNEKDKVYFRFLGLQKLN